MNSKMWLVCAVPFLLYAGASCENQISDDVKGLREEMKALQDQVSNLKTYQNAEIMSIQREMGSFRDVMKQFDVTMHHKSTSNMKWAHTSLGEMREEIKQLKGFVKKNMAKQLMVHLEQRVEHALSQATVMAKETEDIRKTLEQNSMSLQELQIEAQEMRTSNHDLHAEARRLKKQLKLTKTTLNTTVESLNKVRKLVNTPCQSSHTTNSKLRHLQVMRHKLTELLAWRVEAVAVQANIQNNLMIAQHEIDQCAKAAEVAIHTNQISFLDQELKTQRDDVLNVSSKISDLDKMHVSMLELLENVQNVESKVDKTLPEFRKEISKLDVNVAQMNSHVSYNREDTEHLRQSVKAIAFSVSNAIDKAEIDRSLLHHINFSVSALEQLSKQHSYRLYDHILKTEANVTDGHSTNSEDDAYDPFVALPELMGEVKDLQPAHKEYEELVSHLPCDCSTVRGPSGKYLIAPNNTPVETWCNNGSTLLQRRYDGSVEFNLKFSGYVRSFGAPAGEFWMGLENMHQLTADNCSTMRIDMTDIYGGKWFASYEMFYVGPAETGYKLIVGGFRGNASDAFEYQNRMEFSAIDRDRDISNTHCAANYEGGWWFSHCQHVNINGKYSLGLTWFDSSRNEWIAVASSEMVLARRPGCVTPTISPTTNNPVGNTTLATTTSQ